MFRQKNPVVFHALIGSIMLAAMLFAVFPLPSMYVHLRPEFVCLLVIYWVTHFPQQIGIGYAAFIGLIQDVIEGTIWGAHMMALTVIAYICVLSYQRIKNYSTWHQALWMFILVGVHQLVVNWIQGMAGYASSTTDLVLSTLVSALCWPFLFFGLGRFRQIYRIH